MEEAMTVCELLAAAAQVLRELHPGSGVRIVPPCDRCGYPPPLCSCDKETRE
jgi:hypothetical protein